MKNWYPCALPERRVFEGTYVTLEPFDASRHAEGLFEATAGKDNEDLWVYLTEEPYPDLASCQSWMKSREQSTDPLFFIIRSNATDRVLGRFAFMRIDNQNGVIEIGHVLFGSALRRTREASEAFYLMARHVFDDKGYRRFEWKCNADNLASRKAAERFGFTYEGTFRNHLVTKGKNRDTAWFSMIDSEWPAHSHAFEQWLSVDNFDAQGIQKQSLSDLMLSEANKN